jgi:excisionase family DNA binding protein
MQTFNQTTHDAEFMTTREVATLLGLAVRSVQLMVDRGDLQAWRTSGGHRRITRTSLERWRARGIGTKPGQVSQDPGRDVSAPYPTEKIQGKPSKSVLLIEDSIHFQSLVKLLFASNFPDVALHVADDGIVGLSMAGQLQPDVLIVDILLPGIDGATLISTLRSHPQFDRNRLIVLTSLDETQLESYAFALANVPVVFKPSMVRDLPPALEAIFNSSCVSSPECQKNEEIS